MSNDGFTLVSSKKSARSQRNPGGSFKSSATQSQHSERGLQHSRPHLLKVYNCSKAAFRSWANKWIDRIAPTGDLISPEQEQAHRHMIRVDVAKREKQDLRTELSNKFKTELKHASVVRACRYAPLHMILLLHHSCA